MRHSDFYTFYTVFCDSIYGVGVGVDEVEVTPGLRVSENANF